MAKFPPASALYFGKVMHKRLRPFVHAFSYRVFSLYLDLDEAETLSRRLRLFSHNRWNLFSFQDRDHGPRNGSPLRPWIDRHLSAAGIDLEGGAVRLLCFPRVLGYVFNPLSIWFCHHVDGSLRAVLYEVRNTFGEKHGYLIPLAPGHKSGGAVIQDAAKAFYVSPFIAMEQRYDFRLAEPGEKLREGDVQAHGPRLIDNPRAVAKTQANHRASAVVAVAETRFKGGQGAAGSKALLEGRKIVVQALRKLETYLDPLLDADRHRAPEHRILSPES